MSYKSTHIIAVVLIVSFLTLILLSRFTYFPLNLSLVSGYSMYPTLRPGDLLLSIHKDLVGYGVGDLIIWCSSPTYCTAHRVVELGDTYVITKGDNNPSEDPPIPKSLVKYKVVLVIPSIVWLPTCFVFVFLYLIREKEKIMRFVRGLGDVEVIVFSAFTLTTLAVVALIPADPITMESAITRPTMNLRSVEILDPGSLIVIRYSTRDLGVSSVTGCLIMVSDQLIKCASYTLASDSVAVVVPSETYAMTYKNRLTYFNVLVNLTLDKGFLVGNYTLHIYWNKLSLTVNRSSLVLSNPNYVPINITQIKITYMGYDEKARIHRVIEVEELQGFTVGPKNTHTLLVESKGEYAYVMLKYSFMGDEVVEQRRINFS